MDKVTEFVNVGMLKELIRDYPDGTPITVCGIGGLFFFDEERGRIHLETNDTDGYQIAEEVLELWDEVYMDF